jgi:hypothetical protein
MEKTAAATQVPARRGLELYIVSTLPDGDGAVNGTFPRDTRGAAERYQSAGLAVLPLPERSKAPAVKGWQELRLTRADLDGHFPRGRQLNVGILTGGASGNVLDVDLDCQEARRAAPLLLPATGWSFGRTGAPRSHWLYRADAAPPSAAEKFKDLDGESLVELRGSGSQTMAPPSVHPSGETLTWHEFTAPAEAALDDLRRAVRELAGAALIARHWPAAGGRQDAALALAGGLLRGGWGAEKVSRFIAVVAAAALDEELRKRAEAVEATARKLDAGEQATGWLRLAELLGERGAAAARRAREWLGLTGKETLAAGAHGRRTPIRPVQPYRAFPVEALPEPVRTYVVEGAAALGCDAAYLALPALAVAASAVGNARAICLKRGWEEPCVVWSGIVGDSGTLKSPALRAAVGRLYGLQRQLLEEYQGRRAEYELALAELKAAKREGGEPPRPPEPPALRRVVVSDTTVEKLGEILADNPRGLLVARDELSGWLGSFTRYKGKAGGTDLPAWLEMHRAGTVIVDRKTADRPTLFVPRAAVSVCGGIQPGVLARALTPEFLDAGLAARLLLAMPPKLVKRWSEAEVRPETEQAYHGLLDRLLALDVDDRGGEKVPHVLPLSPDGKAAWVAYYNGWAAEQAGVDGELAAAFSKLEGYAARLALLHHVVTHAALDTSDLRPVGARSVEAGVALARWFAGEARRVYATLSESAEERAARRLVEFVEARGGRITVQALRRSNPGRYPTAAQAEQALEALVGTGLADWQARPASAKGGRPTRDCVLKRQLPIAKTAETENDEGDESPPAPTETSPGQRNPRDSAGFSSFGNGLVKEQDPAGPGEGFGTPGEAGGGMSSPPKSADTENREGPDTETFFV